jgi:hypothetical protein
VVNRRSVIDVVVVAAVSSYALACALVHAHSKTGWTARLIPLTVDGLIWASTMIMLDSARRGEARQGWRHLAGSAACVEGDRYRCDAVAALSPFP